MATTAIWPIRGRVDRVISYIQNPEKTVNPEWERELFPDAMQSAIDYVSADSKTAHQYYVSGVNCDPATARKACRSPSGAASVRQGSAPRRSIRAWGV